MNSKGYLLEISSDDILTKEQSKFIYGHCEIKGLEIWGTNYEDHIETDKIFYSVSVPSKEEHNFKIEIKKLEEKFGVKLSLHNEMGLLSHCLMKLRMKH